MKHLRIIIPMLHYYPDHPSGSARLAFDEALFLANRDHEVWVITQDISQRKPEYSFHYGLHVLQYPSPKLNSFDPRWLSIHQLRTKNLLSRYVGGEVDLIHGHSLLHYRGAISLYNNKIRKCYSVHSPTLLEMKYGNKEISFSQRARSKIVARIANEIEYKCLKDSDCITVFSNYTKSLLTQIHHPSIKEKIHPISGWVDLKKFQILSDRQAVKGWLGWPTDVPVFFTLRRLIPRMGLERLLQAFYTIKSMNWKFYLVIGGDGPLKAILEKMTVALDLQENVHFTGFIPEEKLPLLYGVADAFILPTAELECFGLIILEALACGRPVLATPVGAIPEILNRFEPQWLAQNNDLDSIARLIIQFLRKELPMYKPQTLRKTVEQYYSKESLLDNLTDVALYGTN